MPIRFCSHPIRDSSTTVIRSRNQPLLRPAPVLVTVSAPAPEGALVPARAEDMARARAATPVAVRDMKAVAVPAAVAVALTTTESLAARMLLQKLACWRSQSLHILKRHERTRLPA